MQIPVIDLFAGPGGLGVCNEHANQGCLSVHDSLYFKTELYENVLHSLEKAFLRNNLINYRYNSCIYPY